MAHGHHFHEPRPDTSPRLAGHSQKKSKVQSDSTTVQVLRNSAILN